MVLRMEHSQSQYFHEFLKYFEYKVALSGGEELFTTAAKNRKLKSSLNSRLRRAHIGVKLPQINNYSEWVVAIGEVATNLENFADYRPRRAIQRGTRIGPPKTGSAALKTNNFGNEVDGEGGHKMTGMGAIYTAIKDLKHSNEKLCAINPHVGKEKKGKASDTEMTGKKKSYASW